MAKTSLWDTFNKNKPSKISNQSIKSYGYSATRSNPEQGFTPNMIEFLLNSPFSINQTANWTPLGNPLYLLHCYETNPVVNAVINIKADAWSNMRYLVKDLKTGEVIELEEYDKDGGKLRQLLQQPNPLQSTHEFQKLYKVNYEVFGNGYIYAGIPESFSTNFNFEEVNTLNVLPSSNTCAKLTGDWLEQTEKSEIIRHYELQLPNGVKKNLDVNRVWQTNTPNPRLDHNFSTGVSKLVALQAPISNIAGAYETRNVLIYNRGALGFLSSEKKDEGLGTIALDSAEVEQVQKEFKKYGTLSHQHQQIISPLPLKYQRMAMSVKELQLFEEVEADAIAISNALGVPELLTKYYIKGGTFENISASEKRLYDSTIIPESKDYEIGLNTFLKTAEKGIKILLSFDHVAALQADKKDEATTLSLNAKTAREAFYSGAIVYNDYLAAMNYPNDPKFGEKRIWDLDENQLAAISKGNTTSNNSNNTGDE